MNASVGQEQVRRRRHATDPFGLRRRVDLRQLRDELP
jgi:hypothetical protein